MRTHDDVRTFACRACDTELVTDVAEAELANLDGDVVLLREVLADILYDLRTQLISSDEQLAFL